MSSNEFVSKVLWTIVKESGKIHFSQINGEFYKATGFKISDFFEFKDDEMKQFIKMKKNIFNIDDKGYAKARDDYSFDQDSSANGANKGQRNKQNGNANNGGMSNKSVVITID